MSLNVLLPRLSSSHPLTRCSLVILGVKSTSRALEYHRARLPSILYWGTEAERHKMQRGLGPHLPELVAHKDAHTPRGADINRPRDI